MGIINLTEHFVQLFGTSFVAMGIMNWMGSDDGGDVATDDVSADGAGDMFGDEMSSDVEFGEMDDDLGDWDDDDAFGGMDGGADQQAVQEVENRVDDLEAEVAQISSTVNTVRSENEEISESVDEIEENVRKLLEIYEMVTRGVNPFVDDVQNSGMGDGFGSGDFGLFDDDEVPEEDDDLNENIVDAEAESFFDDDAFDDIEDEEDEDVLTDALNDVEDEDLESDGTTFDDLKSEYESGEAEWADEEFDDDLELPGLDEEEDEDDLDLEDDGLDLEEEDDEDELDFDLEEDDEDDLDVPEFELDDEADEDGELDLDIEEDEADEVADEELGDVDEAFEFDEDLKDPEAEAESADDDDEVYLSKLNDGYAIELLIMEWLEFLISEFGTTNTVHALEYYVDIGWVDESVKDDLLDYLQGFADVEDGAASSGPIEMDINDHVQSLDYIGQLTGKSVQQSMLGGQSGARGESYGIQR